MAGGKADRFIGHLVYEGSFFLSDAVLGADPMAARLGAFMDASGRVRSHLGTPGRQRRDMIQRLRGLEPEGML